MKITGEDDMVPINKVIDNDELFTIEEEIESSKKRNITKNSYENKKRFAKIQFENYQFNFNQPLTTSEIGKKSIKSKERNLKSRSKLSNINNHDYHKMSRADSSFKNFFIETKDDQIKNDRLSYTNNDNIKSSVFQSNENINQVKNLNTSYNNKYNNKISFTDQNNLEINKISFTEKNKNDSVFSISDDHNINKTTTNNNKFKKKNKDHEKFLPYKSIDCIFNKKNIWINLQSPEPDKITYDIWDQTKWYPLNFTKNDVINEKNREKSFIEVKHSSILSLKSGYNFREEIENHFRNYLINIEDIPAFYTFKDLIKPLGEENIARMRTIITQSLEQNISSFRSNMSLRTYFKKVDNLIKINYFKNF